MIRRRISLREAANDRLLVAAMSLIVMQLIVGLYEMVHPLPSFPVHWLLEVPSMFLFGLWFKLRGTLSAERIIQLSIILNLGFSFILSVIRFCREGSISHSAFFFSLGVTAMFTTVLFGGYMVGSLGKGVERDEVRRRTRPLKG